MASRRASRNVGQPAQRPQVSQAPAVSTDEDGLLPTRDDAITQTLDAILDELKQIRELFELTLK